MTRTEKNRILLVFPGKKTNLLQKRILINLPLGVLQLAAYLKERGYNPVIHDTRVENEEEFKEKSKGCLAIGFSCMTGHLIKCALKHARIFKQINPEATVIFGGIHPTLLPEQTLEHPLVDHVIVGEGEESLFCLLERIRAGAKDFSSVLGIGYKLNKQIIINEPRPLLDLDNLPMPAYHLVDLNRYSNIRTNFSYQSSRGCPYRCGFCYNLRFSKRHYRAKSAEKVVSDIEYLVKAYDMERCVFVDDEFFINKERVEKYCGLIIERKINIEWNASCRLDLVRTFSDDLLKKIRQSGCKSINFGAESGSDRVLKYMNKDITVEDIVEGSKHTAENGIKSFLSFMAGFPAETAKDTLETKKVIDQLSNINDLILPNTIYPYNPFPGTTLFDDAVSRGLKIPTSLEEWGEWDFLYNPKFPWISKEHNNMIKVLFCVARFRFYLRELKDRVDFSPLFRFAVSVVMSPWILLGNLRWRYNFYKWPFEWDIWLFLMQRVFGFI